MVSASAIAERPKQQDARDSTRVEMPSGPVPEAECETPPGDEWARRPHALGRRPNRCRHGVARASWLRPRGPACIPNVVGERLCSRSERVEDGLVTDSTAATSCQTIGRGAQHRCQHRRVEHGTVAGDGTGLKERGPVQRAGRAPDRRDQAMPDCSKEVTWAGFRRQACERRLDGAKADHEVVTVVAVTQDRIESGQVRSVAFDHDATSAEAGSHGGAIDRRFGLQRNDGAHGRPTIVRPRRAGNAPAALHRTSCCALAFILMTSARASAPSSNPGATRLDGERRQAWWD
jgi:hypothetical protein